MKYLLLMVCLLSFYNLSAQINLELLSNEKIKGYVIDENDTTIVLYLENNKTKSITKKEIMSTINLNTVITYNNGDNLLIHIDKIDSIKVYYKSYSQGNTQIVNSILRTDIKTMKIEKYYMDEYSSFGILLSSPSHYNLIFCYQTESNINVKSIIGTDIIERIYLHFEIGYNLFKYNHFESNISFGGAVGKSLGTGFGSGTNDQYAGIFYDVSIFGIYLEAGYLFSEASYTRQNYIIGLGYVFRFL